MFRRKSREVSFAPLNDCSLVTLGFTTETNTREEERMVPDKTTEAYQKAVQAGGGTFSKVNYTHFGGPYVEATVPVTTTNTTGTLSCRRIEKQDVQPLTATVEDEDNGRRIVAARLGREVTALYCEGCVYRRTGNLDPLAAAQYDLDVAHTETAAAELDTQRRHALRELEQIGRPSELPTAPTE